MYIVFWTSWFANRISEDDGGAPRILGDDAIAINY